MRKKHADNCDCRCHRDDGKAFVGFLKFELKACYLCGYRKPKSKKEKSVKQ